MKRFVKGTQKTCTRKVRHNSAFAALKAVERMNQQGEKGVFAYPCKICRGFHLGSLRMEEVNVGQ